MDIFDKFFKKYSYKFDKGYPDMNNDQDVILLESILEKLGINIKEVKKPFESLSDEAQKVGNSLMDKLNLSKEDLKSLTKNRIIILSDTPRSKIFKQLSDLGYEKDLNIPGSSQGGFRTPEGIEIIVKPKSSQGNESSGKINEVSFVSLINSSIELYGSPITIIFKSSDKNIEYKNVASCKDSSQEGAKEFLKADAQLFDSSGKLISNISLKKQNAIRWESSKTRSIEGINIFKSFIEKVGKIGTNNEVGKFDNVVLYPLGQKGKFKLYQPHKNTILSKVVVKNTPPEILNDVVFGKDNPKTIVIKEDFEGFSNYIFENGILTIECYKIYTDIKDLINTDDEPIFAFSNHIGQNYGIEFRSFSKGLLYKGDEPKGSLEEIDFNDLK